MSDKLQAQLNTIAHNLASTKALKEAGEYVRSAAVLLAPAESGHLRQNIYLQIDEDREGQTAEIYTNVSYARYVELGTGPKGAANHAGISPEVDPVYTTKPWYIHKSQVDARLAEKYGWPMRGDFYICSGSKAHPFMYPALKDNRQTVLNILRDGYAEAIRKAK